MSPPELTEARRVMTVCNSCRYCEGLCAVFPAMELRRSFSDGELDYLANLCHSCGACYADCQFSPPHEFDVNVPRTFAAVRRTSYARHAWPRALGGLFERNGVAVACLAALSVAAFIAGFFAVHYPERLFAAHRDEAGSFYALMPHTAMVMIFGAVFAFAIVALTLGLRAFWRATGGGQPAALGPAALWRALKDAARLSQLEGGGEGCFNDDETPDGARRLYHHLTFYGFVLCFAATSLATVYHYGLGRVAPYAWSEWPVLLGIAGGLGLIAGPAGLYVEKRRRDRALLDPASLGMDTAFLVMLFATGASGLALLVLRETQAMGMMLAIHLGVVFALFLTMPYGKFVHGAYRFAALVRHAGEQRAQAAKS